MTQSRMDNRKIQATLGKKQRTKTNKATTIKNEHGQHWVHDTEWWQTKQQQLRMNTNNIGYMTQNEDKQSKKNKNEHEQHWVHDTEWWQTKQKK